MTSSPPMLPRHVAIIMDGNGRWAQARNMTRIKGHQASVERVRQIITNSPDLGIKYLTLYAFSTENWKRPAGEVSALMLLLRQYIKKEMQELYEKGVCARFIGERSRLEAPLKKLMEQLEHKTADNTRLYLNIAINYGSRDEMTRAVRHLARQVQQGKLEVDAIDAQSLSDCLDTKHSPNPDLVIRTGGDQRLSNFLLWQSAYAEYAFTSTLFPDFDTQEYKEIVESFSARERRFGGVL